MAHSVAVVVRARPGNHSLEGACRIHLTPETLDHAGLRLGDICELKSDDDAVLGRAIAWRGDDTMRATKGNERPAKMSETLREALNVSENQHVRLHKSTVKRSHAQRVVLQDVTPQDHARSDDDLEKRTWRWRAGHALMTCEGFVSGMTFDVTGAKKTNKRRFKLVAIQTSEPNGALCYCDDDTEVTIGNGALDAQNGSQVPTSPGRYLNNDDIGGLLDQIRALNQRMKMLLEDRQRNKDYLPVHGLNAGILLHGFEGTGKSRVLNLLEHAPFAHIKSLSADSLVSNSVPSNVNHIKSVFEEAEAHQPSLVLIDDVHKLVEGNKQVYTTVLCKQMDRLEGTRVLVVAACRNPSELDSAITLPYRLSDHIELTVPDRSARSSILHMLLNGINVEPGAIDAAALASHGYTGFDLKQAVSKAGGRSWERYNADRTPQEDSSTGTVHVQTEDTISGAPKGNDPEPNGNSVETTDAPRFLSKDDLLNAIQITRPSALREITFQPPNTGWSDIGGSAAIKSHFDKTIGWTIHHSDMLKALGRKPSKGILLYGPPGCSKTLTAQAVASHYGLNFLPVKGGELISMYVGESERSIRDLFRKARQAAPCVIFFDEIDSIASERESGSSKGLNVLTTLLTEMDGFERLEGVFILAATNRPEVLDKAIMRAGRLGTHVYLGPPGPAARKEIFDIHLKNVAKEQGFEMESVIQRSEGRSGAEIEEICDLAKDKIIERTMDNGDGILRVSDLEDVIKSTKSSITPEMLAVYETFAATAK